MRDANRLGNAMKLHAYGRSSASFRVRIALNLKGLSYETVSHDLTRDEQRDSHYLSVNPQGLLPALEDDGAVLTQSLAIIEYIDAKKPEPPLLPREQLARARVRALAQLIAADTHPLVTKRVAQRLRDDCGQDEQAVQRWRLHWLHLSFRAFETHLATSAEDGRFCHGGSPTIADIALVPQAVVAEQLGLSLNAYPLISRIVEGCLQLPAFQDAHPDNLGRGEA
jgi:maleylpyruvate isomerase